MLYALLAGLLVSFAVNAVIISVVLGLVLQHLAAKDRAHAEQIQVRERAHAAQVAALCQRLQAPQLAVVEHHQDTAQPGSTVDPVTDQEYEEREQALRDALAEIEAIENAGMLP